MKIPKKNELIAVQFSGDRPFSAITRGGYVYDIEYSHRYGYMYCMSGVGFPRPLSLAGDWWLRAGVPYVSAGPVRLLSQDAVRVETMEDLVSRYDMMETDTFYDHIADEHYPDGEESPYTYWNNELEMRTGPGADEPCHDFHKTAVLAFVNAMGAEFRAAVIAALRGEAAWTGQSPVMREAHFDDAGYRWLACLLPPQEVARGEIDRTLGWLENGGYVNG